MGPPGILNGFQSAVVLHFTSAATSAELQDVREILASSPGSTTVNLVFQRPSGEVVRLQAGADLRVTATKELRERLARWL